MYNLEGSKTADNLLKAFAGESQARNRYTFYAEKAREEGYEQIASIFLETAANEKEHAERFFSFLSADFKGEMRTLNADYPVGIGDTQQNLIYAAEGEHEEAFDLYPEFAKTAREEGFEEVAKCFEAIIVSEKYHEARYNKLVENLRTKKVFEKDEEVEWKCANCGYIHKGKEAPMECPACLHGKAFFEVLNALV